MRFSCYYIPTLKDAPADAEVISHKLLVRAGMIRKISSGIYTFLPLGLRALTKVENIVRQEMDKAGALEVLMPAVQPADLWQESGRWAKYGKELLRFKDRGNRDYCFGPTHEEIITALVRGEIRSYRQLPVNLYQIQWKFRDEIRPRFGLMRGREFLMKDAYSFDRSSEDADKSYRIMFEAYTKIFKKMALDFCSVEADSGTIGGNFSHEFMVLADIGEDMIVSCKVCGYGANTERAEIKFEQSRACQEPSQVEMEEVFTPNCHTIATLAAFMQVEPKTLLKTLIFNVGDEPVVAMVRGDREINEIKLKNYLGASSIALASPKQVKAWTGAPLGFAGPIGLSIKRMIADNELLEGDSWVVGANKVDTHIKNVSLTRDANVTEFIDLRVIESEDCCPVCGQQISLTRGIEVGHVFKLGTTYSKSMNANFLDEQGKEELMVMGCYGIGISRILAASIEQNNDEFGIKFPPPLAPFEVILLNLDIKSEEVSEKAEELYNKLLAIKTDVLLDDREDRSGSKFKDADLIGIPMQLVLGSKNLSRGVIEAKNRQSGEKTELNLDNFVEDFLLWRKKVYQGWGIDIE